jgi:hypothetical protein
VGGIATPQNEVDQHNPQDALHARQDQSNDEVMPQGDEK